MKTKTAVIVGAGAGGAAAARELQGEYQVTVLEEGGVFRPLGMSLGWIEGLRRTGLIFDERQIQLFFPNMQVRRLPGSCGDYGSYGNEGNARNHGNAGNFDSPGYFRKLGNVLVRGRGEGGTTTLSCGNALRLDGDLKDLGIELDEEFAELEREVPVSTNHSHLWHEPTRKLYAACEAMGLKPRPLPKMGRYERCVGCGRCVLGCPRGVKWDSREFLHAAEAKGARILKGHRVERVVLKGDRATGVMVHSGRGGRHQFLQADLVVLAAGGLGTPVILENTGIRCERRLFVDPVLTVAAPWPGARQAREIAMPFVAERKGYIVSPYFDYLSFIFNKAWHRPSRDIVGLMIKLADEASGAVAPGRLEKRLTPEDEARLSEGVGLCLDIFRHCGVPEREIFLGTINAGHPGGSLPLTEREAATLHHSHLPTNLYVADATLLPHALGAPPILTIMALAMRVARTAMKAMG